MSYLIIGLFCFTQAILNIFILIKHPEDRGIVIEEYDSKLTKNEVLVSKFSQD